MKGRDWVMSDKSGFTSANMGNSFIENLNILFEKWKPQPKYHLIKIDDNSILDNYNPTPISTLKEFKKEISLI